MRMIAFVLILLPCTSYGSRYQFTTEQVSNISIDENRMVQKPSEGGDMEDEEHEKSQGLMEGWHALQRLMLHVACKRPCIDLCSWLHRKSWALALLGWHVPEAGWQITGSDTAYSGSFRANIAKHATSPIVMKGDKKKKAKKGMRTQNSKKDLSAKGFGVVAEKEVAKTTFCGPAAIEYAHDCPIIPTGYFDAGGNGPKFVYPDVRLEDGSKTSLDDCVSQAQKAVGKIKDSSSEALASAVLSLERFVKERIDNTHSASVPEDLSLYERESGTCRHSAILFKILCDRLFSSYGIKCRYIVGYVNEFHAWNVILVPGLEPRLCDLTLKISSCRRILPSRRQEFDKYLVSPVATAFDNHGMGNHVEDISIFGEAQHRILTSESKPWSDKFREWLWWELYRSAQCGYNSPVVAAAALELEQHIADLEPDDLGRIMWSFTALNVNPGSAVIAAMALKLERNAANLEPWVLRNIMGFLALFGLAKDSGAITAMASELERRVAEFEASDLALIMGSFGQLGVQPSSGAIAAARSELERRATGLEPADLTVLMCSFLELGVNPGSAAITAVGSELERRAADFEPELLDGLMECFAEFGVDPDSAAVSTIRLELGRRMAEFEPERLESITASFRRLGLEVEGGH